MATRHDQRGADQVWASESSQTAGDSGRALRTLALVAVVVGLIALTTAACVLSYSSVHDFALRAGISRSLARIYPDIGDAMLVMAGCSVLALRGAGLLSRVYGWLCFILLLGALAASGVVHEAGLSMPLRAAEIIAAVFPWALVLVAFGLLLVLLRHAKRRRRSQRASSAGAEPLASSRAAIEPPALVGDEGYDADAYEGTGEYEEGEPYEYGTIQATSQYPTVSPEHSPEYQTPHEHQMSGAPDAGVLTAAAQAPGAPDVVSPTVPLPRPNVEPDDAAAAHPPRAVIRPAEMQLRARTPRQPEPADAAPAESEAKDSPPVQGSLPPEPPTSGFTGDTIPRGELNPAPTSDQPGAKPPELDRPRSSPTPPS